MAKKKVNKPVAPPKGALYYAEFLEHYMGNSYREGWVLPSDLQNVAIVLTREDKGLTIPDDLFSDELLDNALHTNGTPYMHGGIFGYEVKDPSARLKKILAAISKNGVFGSTEEEGSWALAKTAAKARSKVDALERKVKKDMDGGW